MWRLIILLFLFFIIQNQIFAQNDTLFLPQVELIAKPTKSISKTGTATTFDSIIILKNRHQNIAQLLDDNAAVQIQNYGIGQSASVNIRGMGASHTQVYWQDVPLNSNMLGQADISLFPTGLFSEITLSQGASSNTLGNGGLGGNLILDNNFSFDNQQNTSSHHKSAGFKPRAFVMTQQVSDIGNFSTLLSFNYSNKNKYTQTKLLTQNSQNNFRYRDKFTIGQPVTKAQNADFHQHHLMQSFGFRPNDKGTLHTHLWLTDSNRNLAFSHAQQKDRALRSVVSWESKIYGITLAYTDEILDYTNESVGLISEGRSQRVFARTSVKQSFEWIHSEAGFTFTWDKARAPGYPSGPTQIQSSIFSDNNLTFNKVKIKLLLREEWRDSNFSPLLYTINVQPRFDFPLKLNLIHSRNIHYPTFNDRYWQPGGNPDLEAEKAFHWELNLAGNPPIKNTESRFLSLNSQISLFHTRLNNRIQWLPTNSGYWAASNVKRVHSSGLEVQLPLKLKLNNVHFEWKNTYALTHTIDRTPNADSYGNQLPYVPLHKWNSTIRISFLDKISAAYIHNLNGARFTLSDNSEQLPRYHTGRFFIRWNPQENLDINLSINNLWNTDYEVVRGYPMPLRYLELGIGWSGL